MKKSKQPKQTKDGIDWKDKYLRAIADYQNLEKRIESRAANFKVEANRDLLIQILHLVDDIDAAEVFIENEGLKLIKDKLHAMLEKQGVSEINIEGKPFDPTVAEVVEIQSGTVDNIVTKVMQKGYMIHDSLLRPAQVQVGNKL